MADFEISLLLHRLRNTGKKEIISISSSLEIITAQSGLKFLPDQLISQITDISDVEALIIPGGPIDNSQNDICKLAVEMVQSNKLVAAICFGPQFLGRAEILKDYKFTTSCSKEKIDQLGCVDPFYRENFEMSRVVIDRNVITAQGYAFVDFAIAVCDYLKIFDSELQKEEQMGRINVPDSKKE
jgi:putative intracellular protease/amidase